jgi:hypothetical protein
MARRVSCIPSSDKAFGEAAKAALVSIDGTLKREDVAPRLEDLLRADYPSVHVAQQEDLARFFDEDVWYVYREGAPVAASDWQDGRGERTGQ